MKRIFYALLMIVSIYLVACSNAPVNECDSDCFDQRRRAIYITEHPHTTPHVSKAIMEGRVVVGMSKSELLAALGPPTAAVDTNSAWFAREQWVYTSDVSRNIYFFKFGKLTSWHSNSYLTQDGSEP